MRPLGTAHGGALHLSTQPSEMPNAASMGESPYAQPNNAAITTVEVRAAGQRIEKSHFTALAADAAEQGQVGTTQRPGRPLLKPRLIQ